VPPLEWADYPKENKERWFEAVKATVKDDELKDFLASRTRLFNSAAVVYITIPKNSSSYSAYDAGAFGYGILLAAAEPAYDDFRHLRRGAG